jgi:hypothetical protein
MRSTIIFLLLFSFSISGCDIRKREQQLEKRETELNQKEQELLLKEKTLQLKEEELLKKEHGRDSSSDSMKIDSVYYDPELVGVWSVTMNCIETNCPGSAVGDVRIENWSLTYQNNNIIARVIDNNQLVRVYSGVSNSNTIELNYQQFDSGANKNTYMIVRLEQSAKGRLIGRREISRMPENCKIVYSVEMVKQ